MLLHGIPNGQHYILNCVCAIVLTHHMAESNLSDPNSRLPANATVGDTESTIVRSQYNSSNCTIKKPPLIRLRGGAPSWYFLKTQRAKKATKAEDNKNLEKRKESGTGEKVERQKRPKRLSTWWSFRD